ncbi:1744_t:CDS:1, partial [Cetraspora pellucida]
AVYSSKPDNYDEEALQAWKYIKSSFKDIRTLVLNTLLFTNDIH